jgi:hypothetical protein
LGSALIERSDEIELLGIKVKEDLTFSKHIEDVIRALNQRTGILRRLAYHIPQRYIIQVAEGLCTSKLRYDLVAYAIPRVKDDDPKQRSMQDLQVS